MKDWCQKRKLIFRGVYRLSGTGIVEKNHRTIKRMAARSSGEWVSAGDWPEWPWHPYFTTDLRHYTDKPKRPINVTSRWRDNTGNWLRWPIPP